MAGEFEIENRTTTKIMELPRSQLYPVVVYNSLTLPSIFDDKDSKNYLDCKIDNVFRDTRCSEKPCDGFLNVKSDKTIPSCCGLYYFEIKLLSENLAGTVGLGYCWNQNKDEKKNLGSNNTSVGLYLSNRNLIFLSIAKGEHSITFNEKMRVQYLGIGINFLEGYVFCTVNGVNLHKKEIPLKDLKEIYPVISSENSKTSFSVNLGLNSSQFSFNFQYFKMTQLRKKRNQCLSQEYSPKLAFVTVQNLVSDYLLHHGYAEAWESLHKYDNSPSKGQSLETIKNRRLIQKYIIDEDYLSAIDCIEKNFPDFFQQYPIYKFILKCRHFINLIVSQPLHNGQVPAEGTDQSHQRYQDDFIKSPKSPRLDPALFNHHSKTVGGTHYNNNDDIGCDYESDVKDHCREENEKMVTDGCSATVTNSKSWCENENIDGNNEANNFGEFENNMLPKFRDLENNGIANDGDEAGDHSCPDEELQAETEGATTANGKCTVDNDAGRQSIDEDECLGDNEEETTIRQHIKLEETQNSVDSVNHDTEDMDMETMDGGCDNIKKEAGLFDSNSEINGERVMYIIQYGKTLKDEAQPFYSTVDTNSDHQKGIELLTTAFSLIAYRDPYASPFKDILRPSERENLAHQINGTINGMLGRTTKAQLDCLLDSFLSETYQRHDPLTDNGAASSTYTRTSWSPVLSAIHPQLLMSELYIDNK